MENQTIQKRITSIDAFRGATMILMIFANFEAGVFYPYFTHARVIPGLTFVDLIEPMFYFAISLSFMISFRSREKKYGTKDAVWSMITRYLGLMGLGFLTSWGDEFGATFNWGTLQGIGLAGLVALTCVKANRFVKLGVGMAIIIVPGVVFLFGEPVTVDFWGNVTVPGLLKFAFPLNDNMVGAVIKGGMLLVGIAMAEMLAVSKKEFKMTLSAVAVLAAGSLFVPNMFNLSPSTMSPSYCFVSLTLAALFYLLFRFIFDTKGVRCNPLLWWGRNSMLMYVVSETIGMGLIFGDTVPVRFLVIAVYALIMTVIVWLLDRKKWYFRL